MQRTGDILIRAVDRATELVRSTLEFAREGPAAPERTNCVLAAIINEVADQVRLAYPALGVQVSCAPDLEVDADRSLLTRVFSNLLRNAAEASAQNIRVGVSAAPGEIAIVVGDDAGGLPDTVRENLFQPFVRGARRGSTGLGLAIVRDLARAHGGDVTLVETGPSGTSFRITLAATSRRKPRPAAASEVGAIASE